MFRTFFSWVHQKLSPQPPTTDIDWRVRAYERLIAEAQVSRVSEQWASEPEQLQLPAPDPFGDLCDCNGCQHARVSDADGRCGVADCAICDPNWEVDFGGES
jgi:hypothetical protein